MKCLFCNKLLPQNRYKYCSVKCIKRAWYLRKNPKAKCYFANNPDFWKTETGIGFKWEIWASKLLKAEHLKFSNGADLNWNGKLVDVKVSNLYKRKSAHGKKIKNLFTQSGWWVFNRNNEKPIDYFFCICLLNNKPHKLYLIPNNKFPKIGATIGKKSKYEKYHYTI